MALILKKGCLVLLVVVQWISLLLDENTDIHHIFPKAYCESLNLPKDKWNSIVNKTPIFARTNRMIGGSAPSKYLKKIEKDGHVTNSRLDKYVGTHLINVNLIRQDEFNEFFINRAKALLIEISEAMGKPMTNLSGDDVIESFGASLE